MFHHKKPVEVTFDDDTEGVVLSFNLPVDKQKGCEYGCAYCIYKLEGSRMNVGAQFAPKQWAEIVDGFVAQCTRDRKQLVQVSLNGEQPYPRGIARESSYAVIERCLNDGIPLAAVGDIGVPDCIDMIAHAQITSAISMVGPKDVNDRIRPIVHPNDSRDTSRSSWDISVEALEALASREELHDRMFVACTILPGHIEWPIGLMQTLPSDLRQYIQITFQSMTRISGKDAGKQMHTQKQFVEHAKQFIRIGIEEGYNNVTFDDEHGYFDLYNHLPKEHVTYNGNWHIIRMYPDGRVQENREVFTPMSPGTLKFSHLTDGIPVFTRAA